MPNLPQNIVAGTTDAAKGMATDIVKGTAEVAKDIAVDVATLGTATAVVSDVESDPELAQKKAEDKRASKTRLQQLEGELAEYIQARKRQETAVKQAEMEQRQQVEAHVQAQKQESRKQSLLSRLLRGKGGTGEMTRSKM